MEHTPRYKGQDLGERVLNDAVKLAKERWGGRLVAAYALGSLAHGGFSAHVSDVDAGLVLSDPLEGSDADAVRSLSCTVKATGAPLADRLSVFWGSAATLSGAATGGRFPPVDRLDLKQFGRLLAGQDIRARVPEPTLREMVVSAASVSFKSLSTAEVTAQLKNPAQLVAAGARPLTKRILFPVRFVFTARTGNIGTTDAAVEYFTAAEKSPAADLAGRALAWRYEPPDPGDPAVLECAEKGLLPLYRLFIDDYEARLRAYGEPELAQGFRDLRERYQ